MADFSLDIKENEVKVIQKSRYDKNLERGRKFKKGKLKTYNYREVV